MPKSGNRDPLETFLFELQHQLSMDSFEASAPLVDKALEHLSTIEWLEMEGRDTWRKHQFDLKQSLERAKASTELAALREQFEGINSHFETLARAYHLPADMNVLRFYCPMAFDNRGAHWLQNHDQTANPYYGSMMFRCGGQVEALQTAHEEHGHE